MLVRSGVISASDYFVADRQDDRRRAARQRAAEANRRGKLSSTRGSSTTARTKTRRTRSSAITEGFARRAGVRSVDSRANRQPQVARRCDALAVAALRPRFLQRQAAGRRGIAKSRRCSPKRRARTWASCSRRRPRHARSAARRVAGAVRRHALARSRDEGTAGKPSLGVRVRGGADCVLAAVHEGSAAQKAGFSAGDVLIAIDGLRVTGSNLDGLLARYLPGAKVEVHAFRRDELRRAELKLDAPEVTRYTLAAADGRGPAKAMARSAGWRLIVAGPPARSRKADCSTSATIRRECTACSGRQKNDEWHPVSALTAARNPTRNRSQP